MNRARTCLWAVSAFALLLSAPIASAIDIPKPAEVLKWESGRVTSPDTLAELKALQSRVKDVSKQSLQSTVGIIVDNGAGSGVIVSEDGLVLTAAHVIIKPRQTITFVLSDGTFVKGESLGVDKANTMDRGMARITDAPPKNATWPGAKEGKWPAIDLGKSADLKQMQWVVALGHPGGPKPDRPPPVRIGRVGTAKRQPINTPFLITDCTLVGGDSGGPLFDLAGRVIGIHSAIDAEYYDQNMHVPVDKFRPVWDRLLRGDIIGKNPEVALGITYDSDSQGAKGAKIAEIASASAAAKADLAVGDVIMKFNGNPVAQASDISEMLTSYIANDVVKLLVRRDGETLSVDVKLGSKSGRSR